MWGFQTSRSKAASDKPVASFLRSFNWVEDRSKEFRDEGIALRTGISSLSHLPPRPMTLFRRGGEGDRPKENNPFIDSDFDDTRSHADTHDLRR
jgi:hypothetical protein